MLWRYRNLCQPSTAGTKFWKGKEELKDKSNWTGKRWACHDVQQYLSLHHSIKCCSEYVHRTYRTTKITEMKNLFSSPFRYHFVNWRESPRFLFMLQEARTINQSWKLSVANTVLVGNKLIFFNECIWYHVYDAGNWFTFWFAGIWLWWRFYAFWNR